MREITDGRGRVYRTERNLAAVLLLMCTAGCYTFQPVSVAELTTGEGIRAVVSGAFADSLSRILPGHRRIIEGSYVEADGSSVLLDVPVSAAYKGMRLQTLNQRIEIPVDAFMDIERRKLSRTRTGLAVGAIVTASTTVIVTQLAGDTGGGVRPGGDGPVDAMISVPFLSLIGVLKSLW